MITRVDNAMARQAPSNNCENTRTVRNRRGCYAGAVHIAGRGDAHHAGQGAEPEGFGLQWEDPFLLEDQLSDDERLIRDTARAYAQEKLLPRVIEAYLEEKTDRAIFNEMGALGLLGVTIPEKYGCAGASYVSYGLVAREVERVDSGYRSMNSVQSSLVMYPIHAYGSEDAAREVPAEARLRRVGRLLRPDRARCRLRSRRHEDARREGGGRLSADRHQDVDLERADRRRVRGVGQVGGARGQDPRLHPREGHEGALRAQDRRQALPALLDHRRDRHGRRGGARGEPAAQRVGPAGPFGCLNRARYGIAWGAMGAAEDCWHRARQYTLDRKQFGRPLAATQLVQKKLADMQTEISLGLQGALRVGRLFDEGRMAPEMISIVKRNNCGKALDIARVARDMHGGNGIQIEYHVMRHAANLETVNTYEGTHDVHALILGRAQTGLQAFF